MNAVLFLLPRQATLEKSGLSVFFVAVREGASIPAPTVDLCHVDAEGNEIKEIMTFTGLGDFGAKKIKEKSDFLSKLDIEKEQGVRITRQLTSNRALQKALENPEVKNAIMDVIESSIEEILANQKKVEL